MKSIVVFFIAFSFYFFGFSQDNENKYTANPQLNLSGLSNDGTVISINYNVNYDGMVEFELYDKKKELLYKNQYISTVGDHQIKFKATALKPGTYNYQLFYKGKAYSASLSKN